ncbi:MAG: GntR family transcriptional regulator [Anaerolineaceae bacterium]|nr:MAG: GntR family transcriptional regulator [Anaerolineaceae bacterium]
MLTYISFLQIRTAGTVTDHSAEQKLNVVSVRDEVYKRLRTGILDHTYPPDHRLDLSALEEQFGISRTPLKEALHRLEAEGFVEIRPRRGTFVSSLDARDIAEAFDVRSILERAAADIVVEEATDEQIGQLRSIADEMDHKLESDEYQTIVEEYIELDRKFHNLLVTLGGNKRLVDICTQLGTHLQIARVHQKFALADSRHTQFEHAAIMDALEQRDAGRLREAIDEHIRLSKVRTLKALNGNE